MRALTIALIARGHVLVQGVPGLGKTLLAKTLARALGGEFKRIQGTADLMPSDIIGVHVFDEAQRGFVFRPGPLFADVVLVDEINRAGPKTQSALLEAMEERQVSVERAALGAAGGLPGDRHAEPARVRRHLPAARVAARPLHAAHRYRLPGRARPRPRSSRVTAACSAGRRRLLGEVTVLERTLLARGTRARPSGFTSPRRSARYVLDLAQASREHARLALGLSTRGALALLKAARIAAGLRGADFVTPDDVKQVAVAVMAHRLVLTPEAALEGATRHRGRGELLAATAVPR